jgi:hypothetical protein
MKEIYGPWFQMPWWLKWSVFAACRVFSYLYFGWQLTNWLLVDGSDVRAWYLPNGQRSMVDSERLHLDIMWSAAIGKGEMYAGAWVELHN